MSWNNKLSGNPAFVREDNISEIRPATELSDAPDAI